MSAVSCRIYVYTHRRMAITAEDVWLERVIPITDGFAVEEGTDTLWWLGGQFQEWDEGVWSIFCCSAS